MSNFPNWTTDILLSGSLDCSRYDWFFLVFLAQLLLLALYARTVFDFLLLQKVINSYNNINERQAKCNKCFSKSPTHSTSVADVGGLPTHRGRNYQPKNKKSKRNKECNDSCSLGRPALLRQKPSLKTYLCQIRGLKLL